MCGTPNYISPEVATRASHGLETDVWGLGIMLYTVLVGQAPFDTDDGVKSTLTRVVMSDVTFPPYLSAEAKDLISCLLRKNPLERIKLENILEHPFMRKNRFVGSGMGNPLRTKQLSYDSGLASASYQSYKWGSMQPVVNTNVSGHGGCSHTWKVCDQCTHHDSCPCLVHSKKQVFSNFEVVQRSSECAMSTMSQQHSHHSNIGQSNNISRHSHTGAFQMTLDNRIVKPSVEMKVTAPIKPIPVPPISSKRLRPVRQKTKNVIVNIVENGEVCLEFLKNKDGTEKVWEVLRISPDGLRVCFRPNVIPSICCSVSLETDDL